jgi:hypothetical protein
MEPEGNNYKFVITTDNFKGKLNKKTTEPCRFEIWQLVCTTLIPKFSHCHSFVTFLFSFLFSFFIYLFQPYSDSVLTENLV